MQILTDIMNISVNHAVVPVCFKMTTINSVPKKLSVSCLNYHWPIALTPIVLQSACHETHKKQSSHHTGHFSVYLSS